MKHVYNKANNVQSFSKYCQNVALHDRFQTLKKLKIDFIFGEL